MTGNSYLKAIVYVLLITFAAVFTACDLVSEKRDPAPDNVPPSIPQNIRIFDSEAYPLTVQWDQSSDNVGVAGYRVYRNGTEAGITERSSYTDSTVEPGVEYTYSVIAYDAAGNESGQSGQASVTAPALPAADPDVIIDHTTGDCDSIPIDNITAAKNNLHIAYQHTSHGSQIISGMNALAAYPSYEPRYQWSDDGSPGLDLNDYDPIMSGYHDLSTEDSEDEFGNTPWADATRTYLNNPGNYHVNVVMWSWCSISGHSIGRYITNMERLIAEYGVGGTNVRAAEHPVEFVFMTGHTDGSGESGSPALAAAQIRAHCAVHNRWLIDYYDLECYDPDGNYYGDEDITDNLDYDDGNWAVDYINGSPDSDLLALTNSCTSCAHSDNPSAATLNCVLKARAAWWLFARIAGWE